MFTQNSCRPRLCFGDEGVDCSVKPFSHHAREYIAFPVIVAEHPETGAFPHSTRLDNGLRNFCALGQIAAGMAKSTGASAHIIEQQTLRLNPAVADAH